MFYKPYLLRTQRRQQEEEAEAERGTEEEEANQRESLKWTPPIFSTFTMIPYVVVTFEHTFLCIFFLIVYT